MTIFTYLLKSEKDDSYYTGISDDCERRFIEHNSGEVLSTRGKGPWNLVYKKAHESYAEARKHEKWLKKKNRQYKDNLTK